MVTKEFLDARLARMTSELIEYIDLRTEPISQIQKDIASIKECLVKLIAMFSNFKTGYLKLKEDHNKMFAMVNDHEKRLKKCA